jgi:hypothetical protein
MIRGDYKGRAVAEATFLYRLNKITDKLVRIGERGVAGHGAGPVGVVRGVGVECVIEQQIWSVRFKNVDRAKEYMCGEKVNYSFGSFYFSTDVAVPYFYGIGIVFFIALIVVALL